LPLTVPEFVGDVRKNRRHHEQQGARRAWFQIALLTTALSRIL
jgi:hypothetical protein